MYYFDLTLEETIKRHNTRDKKYDFGEESLRAWAVPHDRLRVADEKVFTDETTQEEILGTVLREDASPDWGDDQRQDSLQGYEHQQSNVVSKVGCLGKKGSLHREIHKRSKNSRSRGFFKGGYNLLFPWDGKLSRDSQAV